MDIDSYLSINTPKLQKVKVKLVVESNGVIYEKSIDGTSDSLKTVITKMNSTIKKQDNGKKFSTVNSKSATNLGNLSTPPPLVILPNITTPTSSNSAGNLGNLVNNNTNSNSPKVPPSNSNNSNNIKQQITTTPPQTPPPINHGNNTHINNNSNNNNVTSQQQTVNSQDTILYGISIDTLMARQENMKNKVPLFVKNIINYLFLNCLGIEGIFRISGSQIDINSRKSLINKGDIQFPKEENPHVMSVLFKQFLRELPEPLCTNELYDCFLASSDQINSELTKENGFEVLKKTINMLPPMNRMLFQYIIHFLTFVSANASINLMTSSNLGRIFGPNLFWKIEHGNVDIHSLQATSEKINSMTETLINHYDRIFDEPLKVGKKFNHLSKILAHKKSIQWLICCDNYQRVWSLDSIGSVKVWNSQTRSMIQEISVFPGNEDEKNTGAIYQMITTSNDCVWTATSHSVSVWDSSNSSLISRVLGEAYSLCESQFKQVWVGGAQVINIYDIEGINSDETLISTDLFMKNVYILAMCKVSSNMMWGCSSDKTLYVWDTKTKEQIYQTEIQEKRPKRIAAIVDDEGLETVWIGGDEGNIQIFHSTTFKPIHKILNNGWDKIFNLAALNKEIWCSFWDTQVRIFDPKSKEVLYTLKGYHSDSISSIIEVPNLKGGDSFIWCGSFDKSLTVYTIQSNKWILTNVKKNMARAIRPGKFFNTSTRGTNS